MRFFRRFPWFFFVLLVLLYAGILLVSRTTFFHRQAERVLTGRLGQTVSAEAVRLSPTFALRLESVRVATFDGATLFTAPEATIQWPLCRRGFRVSAPHAALTAVQDASGAWLPSVVASAVRAGETDVFPAISTALPYGFFSFTDAIVRVRWADGAERSYLGVTWSRSPVRMHGRDHVASGVVRVQCFSPAAGTVVAAPIESRTGWVFEREWIEADGRAIFLADVDAREEAAAPVAAVRPAKEGASVHVEVPMDPTPAPKAEDADPAGVRIEVTALEAGKALTISLDPSVTNGVSLADVVKTAAKGVATNEVKAAEAAVVEGVSTNEVKAAEAVAEASVK